jgi:hypothetical protein
VPSDEGPNAPTCPWDRQPDGKPGALKGACPVWGGGWRNVHIARCVARAVPTPRDPTPSPEDVLVTRQVVEAGKLLDIETLDHLVIGQGRYVSMRERGLGFPK